MTFEEIADPARLGWLVTWSPATHTSFLVNTSSRDRRLLGIVHIPTPEIGVVEGAITLFWSRLTGKRAARALVLSYEPDDRALAELEPDGYRCRIQNGLEEHRLDASRIEPLLAALRTSWRNAEHFLVFFGSDARRIDVPTGDLRQLRFSVPESCPGVLGKYMSHEELAAVVVRKKDRAVWRQELGRMSAEGSVL